MEIGTDVLWRGRCYVLVGIDPMNVPGRRAYLREPERESVVHAPYDEVEACGEGAGFASQP